MVVLTEQDSERLFSLFPGASDFSFDNGTNCIFRGVCSRCSRHLSQGSAFLDYYDARFYCANCHQLQEAIIPRAVLYNWNFSLQPVSQPTRSFLLDLQRRPIINVAKLNPTLYAVIPELLIARQLRRMLIFLWHQINRCDASTTSDLLKSFRPFDFMITSLHDLDLYSMQDLYNVQSGVLEQHLLHAINNVALVHVHSCTACRRRALICSHCDDPRKPIWFHEFTTYKWCATPGCPEAMHVDCLAAEMDVPEGNPVSCVVCPVPHLSSTDFTPMDLWKPQCSVCAIHLQTLGAQKIGHFADPFSSTNCPLVRIAASVHPGISADSDVFPFNHN